MDLDLENISKEELVQLFLTEQKRSNKQGKILEKQEKVLQKQGQEIEWLKHCLAELKRMQFGSKRERFEGDKNQLALLFEEYASEEEKKDETTVKEIAAHQRVVKKKNHTGRNHIPEHLPVVEHIVEPEEDTTGMKKIGEERTEILEYVPEKFFKLVIVRPKYARLEKDQDISLEVPIKNVLIASLPSRPIEKCLAGNDLLAAILINKYIDHLPLYRQQQIFKRSGIEIAPSTIDS